MGCHVCDVIELDLQDITRALERRKAQKHPSVRGETDGDLEIRALALAKAQIEAKYSKHRESVPH